MAKKKLSVPGKAFASAHKGRLTRLGWPSGDALAASASGGNRAAVMTGLNLLANMSGDPATRAKAASIRDRIKNMK